MAKTSLRAYLREIESLLEHGQLEEATAHCKHILQSYPKLIAAYRLLGKTYLEDQRYGDAADIFQRVLSSIPDDFVSQVGMSIIREDEGNLDAAIWHMERAFEVQPYNAAIQDELRRIFQRRDGVEPHKIRLTRGALARMYARGDLYQQAIGELQAAETEDAQRPDLQILLARMYYLSGKLVEAVDVCSVLLKKLPYCLEANRLLAAILPQTERKEEAKIYQQRVAALDPYLAAAPISVTSADNTPENIATAEKLDYRPALPGSEGTSQPAWATSLGVSIEGLLPAEESLPDWMAAGDKVGTSPGDAIKGSDQNAETLQTPPAASRLPWEQPAEPDPGLPDWITSTRNSAGEIPGSERPAVTGSLIPNWMKEAGWEPSSGEGEETPPETVPLDIGEQPEGEIARAEIPDWLRAIAPADLGQEQPEAEAGLPWEQDVSPGSGEKLPEWLQSGGEEPRSEDTRPRQVSEPSRADEEGRAEVFPAEETPWIPEPIAQPEAEPEAEPETEPEVELEAVAQIELEDELEAEPQAELEVAQQAEPQAELQTGIEAEPVPDLTDQDAALAWLESLAARQGADEEELITRPEERSSEIPSWLRDISQEEQALPAPPETVLPEPPAAPAVLPKAEPAGEWLPEDGISGETIRPQANEPEVEDVEGISAAAEAGIALPDWLRNLPKEEPTGAQEGELAEPAVDMPDWLKAAMQEAPLETAPEEDVAGAVEGEIPEWLQALGGTSPKEEEGEEIQVGEPSFQEVKLPEWLEALEEMTGEPEAMETPREEPAAGEAPVTAEYKQAPAVEEPVGETPALVEFEPGADEAPTIATPAPEAQVPAAGPGFDLSDQDAAFAWLESLAAKQGASEEELFTEPEERSGEAPTWLREAAQGEAPEVQPVPEEPPAVSPDLADTKPVRIRPDVPQAVESQAIDETPAPAEQAPEQAWLLPVPEHQLPEVEIQDLAEEEPATEEIPSGGEAVPAAETIAAETLFRAFEITPEPAEEPVEMQVETFEAAEPAPVESIEAVEEEPELPAWLSRIAAGEPETEDFGWKPPEAAAEAAPAETGATVPEAPVPKMPIQETPIQVTPAEEPLTVRLEHPEEQVAPEQPPVRQVNINTASLIELESLPGVGFIQAQNILAYREAHGPFEQVEDLLSVPGFNPATLDEIQERLNTGVPEKPREPASFEDLEPESVDPDQSVLIQARNALIQENLAETVARYSYLIEKERMLDTVIRDLYEALYHFPTDISIWQTLGDAYVRNNQLQEALDAYVKAEELLR